MKHFNSCYKNRYIESECYTKQNREKRNNENKNNKNNSRNESGSNVVRGAR